MTPDEMLLDTALKLLQDGPMPLAALVDRLRELGHLDHLLAEGVHDEDIEAVITEQILDTDAIWSTPDDVYALSAALMEGLVLTHRLTEAERSEGAVRLMPDLVILDWDAQDRLELVGGDGLESLFGDHTPGEDNSTFAGPDGWLDGFAAGDLLAFTRHGNVVDIEAVAEPHEDTPEVDLLRAAAEARIPRGQGEECLPVVLDALVADPTAFRRPLRPLGELLATAGLERRGFSYGRVDEEWKTYAELSRERRPAGRARDWHFDPCCEDAFDTVEAAFLRSRTDVFDDIDVDEVATALAHGDVASAFAVDVLDGHRGGDERLLAFASGLVARSRRNTAPARLLLALEAESRGEAAQAEAHLQAGLLADPDYGPIAMELARYELDRSRVDQAVALLHHPDVVPDTPRLEFLERFRAQRREAHRGIGRNDACPCGSGRKFKACCQRTSTVPLAQRTGLLAHKLALFTDGARRRPRVVGIASSACDPDDPSLVEALTAMTADPFIIDVALFEGGVAKEYLEERAALLPDDECQLLERLVEEPRRLWEVIDVDRGTSLTLRDTRMGERFVVTERTASKDRQVGEYLLARVAALGDEHQLFGVPLAVPLCLRERTIELIDAGPDADGLAEWYGEALEPPRVVNRENEPLVVCRAELTTDSSPSALHAALDDRLERDGPGQWMETWSLPGGDTILRGTVRYDAGRLVVEANSEARFDRLVSAVMDVVPDARVVDEEREDAERLRRSHRAFPDQPLDESPELQAALDDYVRHKEVAWVEEPVPALGGLTPRQALDDPTRREDLLALLREAEAYAVTGGRGFDPARLRALLGLDV
jgi:hypothetical protein